MIPITLEQIAVIVKGKIVTKDKENFTLDSVAIDTRKVQPNSLFIAIKGHNHDGYDFIAQAISAGAVAAIVNRPSNENIAQIIVVDTHLALGQLAAWVRQQMPTKVIALTGSSGKTSVKEMTAQILSRCGKTLYTEGNLNNDIGVPLTLLNLMPDHEFAVIELGANHIGEISYMTHLVQPQSALINNLLAAHIEGFGSANGVAQAKGEIFEGLPVGGYAIINADNNALSLWKKNLKNKKISFFSVEMTPESDFYATNITVSPQHTVFELHSPQGNINITLPLLGIHNVSNALAASALAMSVGADLTSIQQGLAESKPVKGRLYPIILNNHQIILDDTYNANVGSMIAAAKVLAMMPGYKIMVVGDMGELGQDALLYHKQVGDVIKHLAIDKVMTVGSLSEAVSSSSGKGEHFHDKSVMIKRLKILQKQHDTLTFLIKGSRSAAMEQIIEQLQ